MESRGDFFGSTGSVPVFFSVRPVAIPILKIDAKVFDGFSF